MSAHTYTKVRNCDTLIVLFVSHVSHMPFPMFPWQYMYLSVQADCFKDHPAKFHYTYTLSPHPLLGKSTI